MDKKYKVLFCDLDGTLIDTISGSTFPKGIWDMKFKFDVLEAIKKLSPECVFIVTNQGGIEKGFVNSEHFESKLSFIINCIYEYCGVNKVDGLVCSSNSKTNHFRKPNPGMLETFYSDCRNAYNESWFVKENMLMIGDASGLEGQFSDSDKKTAENFGIDYLDVYEFVKKYSPKFDVDLASLLRNKVVNCRTQEESYEFRKIAANQGYLWLTGFSPIEHDAWRRFKEETCYCLESYITYADVKYYECVGCDVISFKDFIKLLSNINKDK